MCDRERVFLGHNILHLYCAERAKKIPPYEHIILELPPTPKKISSSQRRNIGLSRVFEINRCQKGFWSRTSVFADRIFCISTVQREPKKTPPYKHIILILTPPKNILSSQLRDIELSCVCERNRCQKIFWSRNSCFFKDRIFCISTVQRDSQRKHLPMSISYWNEPP